MELDNDYIINMPPKNKKIRNLKITSIKKAVPKIIIPDEFLEPTKLFVLVEDAGYERLFILGLYTDIKLAHKDLNNYVSNNDIFGDSLIIREYKSNELVNDPYEENECPYTVVFTIRNYGCQYYEKKKL